MMATATMVRQEPARAPTASLGDRNQLLAALPADALALLSRESDVVQLQAGDVLHVAGWTMRHAYFPRSCVVALVALLTGEPAVEGATVGCEGVVGLPLVLGGDSSRLDAVVVVPGEAVRVPAASLRTLAATDAVALRGFLRYAHALSECTAWAVTCTARHQLEQRIARWLLMTHDRVGSARFELTQETLAQLLGVRRASVSEAAAALKRRGLIHYTRGRVTITRRSGLEGAACACYRAMAAQGVAS